MFESFNDFMNEKMVSAKRGHNYFIVTKPVEIAYIAGKYGMGMEIPGVLLKNKDGYFEGKKGAYIIDYFGAMYYVDMEAEVAMKISDMSTQKDLHKAIKPVNKAPEHADWKGFLNESTVNEARSIAKIQKEWSKVTAIMQDTVAKWKKAEGQEKEDLKDELKTLTISKKKLEAELDDAVGLKDVDVELTESMVNEGMFSFKTLGDNKAISARNGADIYMFDDKGNMWHEENYEGYGIFGGKDFFDLMAEMNGEIGRDAGIDLYFSGKRGVLYPALTRDKNFKWKRHKFTTKIKDDPSQGMSEALTEEYILQHGGKEFKSMDREVRESDKEAVGAALSKIYKALVIEGGYDHDQFWAFVVSFMDGSSKYRRMLESVLNEGIKKGDIKVGRGFKIGDDIFRIIEIEKDRRFGPIANTERIDDITGSKYTYRDTVEDLVAFFNEEGAIAEGMKLEATESINEPLNERVVTIKRRYTENYPALTAGKSAKVRNKMLEAIADGKITQEEFDAILREMSTDTKRWSKRNAKYFNVSEDGISLSKFGRRILNQIAVNEAEIMINEKRENWIVYTGEIQKKFYSEHRGRKSAEKMVDMAMKVLNQVGMMPKSLWEKEKEEGRVMEDTVFLYESFAAFESAVNEDFNDVSDKFKEALDSLPDSKFNTKDIEALIKKHKEKRPDSAMAYAKKAFGWLFKESTDVNESAFVVWYEDKEGKHLLGTFHNKRAADKYKSEEEDEVLNNVGVKSIGTMSKKMWDKNEAPYIKESAEVNEAFKSSKLRNLLTMRGADAREIRGLASAFYGFTKFKLDELTDAALRDVDVKTAYKEYQKDKDFVVFYIVDNQKVNPYADDKSLGDNRIEPGILAVTRGKDFLGSTGMGSKNLDRKATFYKDAPSIGGDKRYSGWGASGIYNVKRAADLADRAIVVWLNNEAFKSTDKIEQRADAKAGAIAFKSDKDFKWANMERYKEILAANASKLPLDKMVEGAINELTKQIAKALKDNNLDQYGGILIGMSPRGRRVTIKDAGQHMSNILDDYSRYSSYMKESEQEKAAGYSSGFYEKEAKQYAKKITDGIKKIKKMNYAW